MGGGEGTGSTTVSMLDDSAERIETPSDVEAVAGSVTRLSTALETKMASDVVEASMSAVTETDEAATNSLMREGSTRRAAARRSKYACWSNASTVLLSVARKRTRRTSTVLGSSGGRGGGGDGEGSRATGGADGGSGGIAA